MSDEEGSQKGSEDEQEEKAKVLEVLGPKSDPLLQRKKVEKIFQECLEDIDLTADGKSYAFTKLVIDREDIHDLYDILGNYPHLRNLNMMGNNIKDIHSVSLLPYLLKLDSSRNQIIDMEALCEENKLQYLQELNLSGNKIEKLGPIQLPNLQTLNLSKNKIETLEEFKGHKQLKYLTLQKNKLRNLNGLKDLPSLTELHCENNKLIAFGDMSNIPKLAKLYLKFNRFKTFGEKLPEFPSLGLFDFQENKIGELKEIATLKQWTTCLHINVSGNLIEDEHGDAVRKEILIVLDQFQKINDQDITEEERKEASDEKAEREKERLEKLKEEEEERKRLAAEAKEDEDQ